MTKAEQRQVQENARQYLKEVLVDKTNVHGAVIGCNAKGTARQVMLLVGEHNNVANITFMTAKALGYQMTKDQSAIIVKGGGFDACLDVIHALAAALYGDNKALNCVRL